MALNPTQQLIRWIIVFAFFFAILYFLGGVVTPYLVALALAYFLDPIADRLEAAGLSRLVSVAIITVVAAILFTVLLLSVGPPLGRQLAGFIEAFPGYARSLRIFVETQFPAIDLSGGQLAKSIEENMQGLSTRIAEILISSTQTAIGFVAALVVVPVVTFFTLLDWDNMVAKINSWLPQDHAEDIRGIFHGIDTTLAGFVRGQGSVCLIMAAYYGTMLGLMGVNYGLALGFIAGTLTFIPYVGGIVGGFLAIGMAIAQFYAANYGANAGEVDGFVGSFFWLIVVLVLYFGGQTFEGNFLTPRLVGRSVGLHPVWVIFSLSAFGSLMGLTGMLIAVPVAASIGVIGRFMIGKYLGSSLYLGHNSPAIGGSNPPLDDEEQS